MGSKLKPGAFDCYRNAEPDEPMFILLARDLQAAGLVELWADQRQRLIMDGIKPFSDRNMVTEARESSEAMREWRAAHRPQVKWPGVYKSWLQRIRDWVTECFGADAMQPAERAARLLEEATEVAQACGLHQTYAIAIVQKTYSRPAGQVHQELGGVGIAFLGACAALYTDPFNVMGIELDRIETPEIRAKAKRRHAENMADGTSTMLICEHDWLIDDFGPDFCHRCGAMRPNKSSDL